MLKLKCNCPSCKRRVNSMFERIVTNQFTDAENCEIAKGVVSDFGQYRVQQFLRGDCENEDDGA